MNEVRVPPIESLVKKGERFIHLACFGIQQGELNVWNVLSLLG
jgi:hypothetical protein